MWRGIAETIAKDDFATQHRTLTTGIAGEPVRSSGWRNRSSERSGQERQHDCSPAYRSRSAKLQQVGRQPDARRLCAALHRKERAQMVELAGRQHRHRGDLLPRPRGDRRRHHGQLRLRQRHRRHSRGRRTDLPDRAPDRLLRRDLRRRYRPPHARGRLRLHRLDRHVADLCLLHLSVLRDRGGDHVARPGAVVPRAAVPRLHRQLGGGDPARHPRHHLHQPASALDPADLARPAYPAVRLHRHVRCRLVRGVDALWRPRGSRRPVVRPAPVRRRLDGGVLADRADRRAGRFSALPASPQRRAAGRLVDRLPRGRPGMDRAGPVETAGGLVPRLPRGAPFRAGRKGGRADADVSGRVPVGVFLARRSRSPSPAPSSSFRRSRSTSPTPMRARSRGRISSRG